MSQKLVGQPTAANEREVKVEAYLLFVTAKQQVNLQYIGMAIPTTM